MSTGGIEIELTPKQGAIAVAIIVVIGACVIWFGAPVELDEAAKEDLRVNIAGIYLMNAHDRSKARENSEGGELAEDFESLSQVEILETTLRGKSNTGEYVVAVRYSVGGGTPSDGKEVRYFQMYHDRSDGWAVVSGTNERSFKSRF
jgi:hypothetical protein